MLRQLPMRPQLTTPVEKGHLVVQRPTPKARRRMLVARANRRARLGPQAVRRTSLRGCVRALDVNWHGNAGAPMELLLTCLRKQRP